MKIKIKRLFIFAYHEAMSCLFPVSIFLLLAITKYIHIPHIPRYDIVLLGCILIQIIMYVSKLETKDELKVICVFHVIGIVLEIFKVHMGSWSYPEEGYIKIGGVPLYSGFMYASVASYICQAWKRLALSLINYPNQWFCIPFGLCIYVNFFSHHWIYDIRWILIGLLFILFFRSKVAFTVDQQRLSMPLPVSFLCIGFFIWLAENIATFLGAWRYPNQLELWHMVHPAKIVAWFLLVIVSVVIVAEMKRKKGKRHETTHLFGSTC